MTKKTINAGEDAAGRLDVFLAANAEGMTRSHAAQLIERGAVLINGASAQAARKVRPGDVIDIEIEPPRELSLEPQDIPIDIVYEDDWLAVINKRQGMVVHPAAGSESGTLVNALLFRMDGLSGINGVVRPGIVHRLDKDTSGLLVVAKNDAAHVSLAEQIKEKTAERIYLALVYGKMSKESGTVDAPIARSRKDRKKMAIDREGRSAVTHWQIVEEFRGYTLLRCKLETGRTHQIRVHLASLGHGVVGDAVYCDRKNPFDLKGQLLHAEQLSFDHPQSAERMTFHAPLPDYYAAVIEKLRNK